VLVMSEAAAPSRADRYNATPLWKLLTLREWAAVGAIGGALAVASFVRYGAGTHAVIGAILGPALVALSAVDLRYWHLPDIFALPAAGAIPVVVAIGEPHHLVTHLAAGFICGAILFVLALVRPPGEMGVGDAKLVFLIGVALGSRTIAAMVYTSGLVIAIAVFLIVLKTFFGRGKGLKTFIGFGPVLALGAIVAYFTG
jgi:leader peptidase (prepilin peptidase)/N-methyltransferase